MNKQEIYRFQQIAGGGKKKLNSEIKRLPEIDSPKITRKRLSAGEKEEVNMPVFDEKSAYKSFIEEKARLKEHYKPFLCNYSEPTATPVRATEPKEFYYRKETEEDKLDFSKVLNGEGEWESVVLPKYEGPTGKWNAFYRTTISLGQKHENKRYIVDFEAVDYIAEIYLNGRLITRHEGFFAPFSADLTENIREGENVLS